ncbi:hypothetical protein BN1708_015047 [Verticillium longisporum]|uniref:Uncharacterized protein n=1 Tax=Verticillium longisporum TaxID=100787 RepID=A0A0G4M120_VERLO|nr:hypothetical protein BN1708_015047 [Verticillium longisporum]
MTSSELASQMESVAVENGDPEFNYQQGIRQGGEWDD